MNILVIGNSESVHTARFSNAFSKKGHNVCILSTRVYYGDYVQYDSKIIMIKYLNWLTAIFQFIFGQKLRDFNPEVSSIIHPMNLLILFRHFYLLCFINVIIKKVDFDSVFSLNISTSGLYSARIKKKVRKICKPLGCDLTINKFPRISFFLDNITYRRNSIKKQNYILAGFKEATEKTYKILGFLGLTKIEFLGHWGIETDRFSPSIKSSELKKQLYNLEKDTILAVCFRQPRTELDFENIIKAIAKTLKKYNNLYFAIGTGGTNVGYLIKLAQDLQIEKNLLFIDFIKYEKLNEYIAQGDIYIDPANIQKSEAAAVYGISGSILESMSCGLIPVVSNRPHIKDYLPPEGNPFIFEDFEVDLPDALEKAIIEKDNQVIKNAMRQAIMDKTNWNNYIDKLLILLKEE